MAICEKVLAFVVLHYGDENLTYNCLKSIGKNDESVYVVLNGEEEKIKTLLEKEFPLVQQIALSKNLGFAGGMNKGIRRAIEDGYKWIVILNNDVECMEDFEKKTRNLVREVGEKKVVFSPLIYDKSGEKIWFKGGKFSKITARAKHLGMGSKEIPFEKSESDFLTGCSMCFPARVNEDAGLMDESYFLYWEDIDWSLKLKQSGYKLFVCPEIKLKHIGSASSSLESKKYLYYYFRNHLRFIFKNISCFLLPITLFFFGINLLRIFFAWLLLHGKEGREKISAVLEGIKDFILQKEGEKVFN